MDDGAESSPPPIRVEREERMRRQPNWDMLDRIRLLDHVLKYMEDPTRARDKAGQTKMDMEMNVLPKVSPHLREHPLESRKLDEITAQFYRYNYQHNYFV